MSELAEIVEALASATVGGQSERARDLRQRLAVVLSVAPVATAVRRWKPVVSSDLPRNPGVYVIAQVGGNDAYVGLALDLWHRFHNADYGHLGPNNKTRSSSILQSGSFEILLAHDLGVERVTMQTRLELARLEIATYAELMASGRSVLNSLAMIGRVGETPGSPVLLCSYESGELTFCDTLATAIRLTRSTAIPAVVHGYQRTAVGVAARWASEAEAEGLADHVGETGYAAGSLVREVVSREKPIVEWTGTGRNAGFVWRAGLLSATDLEHLRRYGRARYQGGIPKSRFHGVSWESRSQGWQCRAKTGPGAKDLWQTRRSNWESDVDAAIFREDKIAANGWEVFNSGRYASNAEELNAVLGTVRFRAW